MMIFNWTIVILLILLSFSDGRTTKKKEKTYYEILEIEQNATQREIRKAYFALVKIYHPDKNEKYEEKKKVREQFEFISNAYEILSDEEKRTEYDRQLLLGNTEYKEPQTQKPQEEPRKHTFKDPLKAYEEALKKEEEEAFRENMFRVALICFGTLFALFTGWVVTKFVKRTRFYHKIEKQKQEQENRKLIVESKKKRTVRSDKAQKELIEHTKRREEIKNEKKKKRATLVDENKVTKWADSEESNASNESSEEDDKLEKTDSTGASTTPITPESQTTSPTPDSQNSIPTPTNQTKSDNKNGIYCFACKKFFKSVSQWENHEISKKHKQAIYKLKPAEKETYKQKLKDIQKFVQEAREKEEVEELEQGKAEDSVKADEQEKDNEQHKEEE